MCGEFWTTDKFFRCPFCESGDYFFVPISTNKKFCYTWLERNGFPFIKELLEVEEMEKLVNDIYKYVFEGEDVEERAKEVVEKTISICMTIVDNYRPIVKE